VTSVLLGDQMKRLWWIRVGPVQFSTFTMRKRSWKVIELCMWGFGCPWAGRATAITERMARSTAGEGGAKEPARGMKAQRPWPTVTFLGGRAEIHGWDLDTPSQRVQFILGTEEDEEHVPHELFTELDEICMKEGEDAEWKETARWLKFEEDVEDGGERWSKPYVATLSLHSLFELRSCLINGTVLLDMRANSIEEISDLILDQQELFSDLNDSMRVKVREALLKKHHHQKKKEK